MTHMDWEKAENTRQAKNLEVLNSMSAEQRKALNNVQESLRLFLEDFTESFDVTVDTARVIDKSYWQLLHAFKVPEEEENENEV